MRIFFKLRTMKIYGNKNILNNFTLMTNVVSHLHSGN